MSFMLLNPAGFSHLSSCPVERRTRAFRLATAVANYVLLTVDMPARIELRLWDLP